MPPAAFAAYLDAVQRELEHGRAGPLCRDALKRLLVAVAPELRLDDSVRRAQAGGPDFVLWRGAQPAAWVFVGAPDRALQWRAVLPNVLVTDYLTFTWHTQDSARTARAGALVSGRLARDRDADAVLALLEALARWSPPPGPSAPTALAAQLGAYARALYGPLLDCAAGAAPDPELRDHLAALRAALLPDLTAEAFAAMYAQTFAYTLLAARLRHRGPARRQPFTRGDVPWNLPPTNPLLRDWFRQFAGRALDERVAWVLDALAAALDRADASAILRAFSQRARADDPLAPFHLAFSAHFDPQQPPLGDPLPAPLASYAARSVDYLLRRRFRRGLGLADVDVSLFDPAAGTGAFLFAALNQVYATMFQQRQLGGWNDYVSDYLLPRAVGCETDLGLYALAHLKLSLLLEATGYDFASAQRLSVFLADPLADFSSAKLESGGLGAALYAEAQAARMAGRNKPVAVVLSCVPAGPGRTTPGAQLARLISETYQPSDNKEERGWPPDAYINYLRLAQQHIEEAGSGVAVLISASSCLDDPALATMRRNLLSAFNDIYLLRLHDPRATESTPDESLSDALLDTVLAILVRRPNWTPGDQAHVRCAPLRGGHADKLAWLANNDLTTTVWQDIAPQPPHYTFLPYTLDRRGEYTLGWPLDDVFAQSAPGFQVLPGAPAVALNRDALCRRAAEHASHPISNAEVIPCLYRPFDRRWLWLDARAVSAAFGWSQLAARSTPCLLAAETSDPAWPLVWAAADPVPADLFSDAGGLRVFPIYSSGAEGGAASPFPPGPEGRQPNLNPAFILKLASRLGMTFIADGQGDLKNTFGPEDVFAYAYAVLNAPAYRARYAEFLRADLPRLPLTGSKKLFRALARKGNDLSGLHLLRRADAWPLITGFVGGGPALVDDDYPRFIEIAGERPRLYINRDKYFEGVPRAAWEFRVGERRPLYDWLAARRGLALDWQALRHFQQAVVALRDTLALLAELDALITAWPIV